MGKLANKVAVITGGTTGLGFAMAKLFVAEGAQVVVTGRSRNGVDRAAEALGDGATPARADVRNLADLESLATLVGERWGRLDVLVANAGLGTFTALENVAEDAYDEMFDVNVKGVFFTVQKLAPLMGEGGSVILVASAAHGKGFSGGAAYCATKAAVRSFARSFAIELAPRGVRVNALSPGLVFTAFQEKMGMSPEAMDGLVRSIKGSAPLGRPGEPEEIARAALFLASEDSSYMTAADLDVDGGFMNV